jgi:hypothetical protein
MAEPENMPAFEQFNFRPEGISIEADTVTFETPYYNFTFCKGDRTWSVTSVSNSQADEAEFDYEQMLADIANPDYSTIEIDGETYEYRVRLQAEWLNEQIASSGEPPFNPDASAEEVVYFELKLPDGELLSQQLYTLSDLQTAQLGASLGVPEIAGAVAVENQLWFAATAEQGEGNSGFASLIHYDLETNELSVDQPAEMQGNQISAIAATNRNNTLTLWLGTKRSGEGNPHLPADGLVSYQPDSQGLTTYSVANSALVGAIPFEIAVEEDFLWVATGEGVCEVEWQTVDSGESWNCWEYMATADLPAAGVDLYNSFLATEPTGTLNQDSVEVLWVSQTFEEADEPAALRYEVAYEPGFEVQIPQGGYWLSNEVARRTTKGSDIFWPGHAWHWQGDRFTRSLDEVALNMVGGGPHGLADSNTRDGFYFDSNAIRGDFDLLDITSDSTKVRHYSGWVDGSDLSVYPTVVSVDSLTRSKPNPLVEMAASLPESPGP